MYYQFYEWNHAFLSPARALNDAVRLYYRNPLNPLTHTEFGRQIAAAGDLFERMTRHYGKPDFEITETLVDGQPVAVSEEIVWERPFCRLVRFARALPPGTPKQPKVVVVAPMSGHYATLLRGTVQALLPHNDVYITDWVDARKVPLTVGRFDLDDFITYIIDIIHHFEGDAHLVAVCQPAVPVFAATAIMERRQSAVLPKSITLMGGPIDTRQNPTEVNTYAESHDLDWFRRNVVMVVPFPHPGVMRKVYPGFLQLTGFMTMNLDRHLTAHYDYFDNLVKGDGDSADKHRDFYDEYLSVMDLTAEFYLQTVDTVFLRHALPKGEMTHRGEPVDPKAITRTPILTIEGEKDDISGLGQTRAAHALASNLPDEKHNHYEQEGVGHYGVFNGSRFRNEIAPRICAFVAAWDEGTHATLPAAELAETAAEMLVATEAAARHVAEAADTLNDLAAEAATSAADAAISSQPLQQPETPEEPPVVEATPAAAAPDDADVDVDTKRDASDETDAEIADQGDAETSEPAPSEPTPKTLAEQPAARAELNEGAAISSPAEASPAGAPASSPEKAPAAAPMSGSPPRVATKAPATPRPVKSPETSAQAKPSSARRPSPASTSKEPDKASPPATAKDATRSGARPKAMPAKPAKAAAPSPSASPASRRKRSGGKSPARPADQGKSTPRPDHD